MAAAIPTPEAARAPEAATPADLPTQQYSAAVQTAAVAVHAGIPRRNPVLALWTHSLFAAFGLYAVFLLYASLLTGSLSFLSAVMAFAGTAAILIGTSFALSGICYFFNFADSKIVYRKYLGVVGYASALTYSILLIFLEPERYMYGWPGELLKPDVLLGLTAMSIFTLMALVSNNTAIKLLGPHVWREILHLGYLGYGLLVIRAVYLDHAAWAAWFTAPTPLPPFRLTLSLFACSVILLRAAVAVHKTYIVKK